MIRWAAGCTSVVKPASATPLTAALILRAIEDAGAPPGVVNLVTSRSSGMVAETIFADARVRKVSFTGSTEVGKLIMHAAADRIVPVSLELGGKSPCIVFPDSNDERTVEGVITAMRFTRQGQSPSLIRFAATMDQRGTMIHVRVTSCG